ncbi:MAG: electron transfer flavoprotein subunit beta/FixA family protein [Candidatus Hydrogenedentes bacterium]|nr:electron transfer flavoprotein subunit beta/FixA family protein [Candidatus Hydrogenedentota bacterium]
MKIAVLVKRVPDTASVFTIQADGKSVELSGLKFVMSPYDEHAMEEAIQLREQEGGEVVVVCAGSPECRETIRMGLAMGADSGLLVTITDDLTGKGLAAVLAAALQSIAPDIIFAGKQAVDSDGAQVPERVAELMGIPHASCITQFVLESGKAVVNREVEGGHYVISMELPALFTTQKGINTPRYPTLPNIMKAKRKPIEEIAAADLLVDEMLISSGMAIEKLSLPRQDRLCKVLDGEISEQVTCLYRTLREEEKVMQ